MLLALCIHYWSIWRDLRSKKFPRGQWLCMVLELYLVEKYNTSILKGEYGSFVTGTMKWGGGSGTTLVKL